MERGAYQQNASICRCFPARPCARGRYYLCERSVFGAVLARGVGNPLRPRSVIPCAKGRYPLRERSVSFARKVGIPCAEGLYFRGPHRRFLRERSVFFCCRTRAQVSRPPFYASAADVFCTMRILRERSVFLWGGSHPLATLREGSVFGLIAMG